MLQQGLPQSYEGFGLHLVDVTTSLTTGGINVSSLEAHYTARLGNVSSFDAFMDFNVVLFAGEDLPSYTRSMAKDGVPFLSLSWKGDTGGVWFSVMVHVPLSQMVLELVSQTPPHSTVSASLEPRLSPRQVSRFAATSSGGVLQAVAVTRACSNISAIEYFYTTAIKARLVHSVDEPGLARRCYAWPGAASDVCFVSRSGRVGYDSIFSVRDFETMLWSAHKAIIGTDVNIYNDVYNDNHCKTAAALPRMCLLQSR